MRFDDYTDDMICTAMGFGPFVPVGKPSVIRVLLKPSFHPEVCITLEPTLLSVIALRSTLWREPVPRVMDGLSEATPLSTSQFDSITRAFHAASAANRNKLNYAMVDGMAASAVLKQEDQVTTFSDNPFRSPQAEFVAEILRLAYGLLSSIHLKNAVARCGGYIDLTLAAEPEPEQPQSQIY
jgi:hypothetical protein